MNVHDYFGYVRGNETVNVTYLDMETDGIINDDSGNDLGN